MSFHIHLESLMLFLSFSKLNTTIDLVIRDMKKHYWLEDVIGLQTSAREDAKNFDACLTDSFLFQYTRKIGAS